MRGASCDQSDAAPDGRGGRLRSVEAATAAWSSAHAGADSATVHVADQAGALRLTVSDDGAGFDPDAGHPGHLGLLTMVERAEAIGAELIVTSAPGEGTTVAVCRAAGSEDHGRAGIDAD